MTVSSLFMFALRQAHPHWELSMHWLISPLPCSVLDAAYSGCGCSRLVFQNTLGREASISLIKALPNGHNGLPAPLEVKEQVHTVVPQGPASVAPSLTSPSSSLCLVPWVPRTHLARLPRGLCTDSSLCVWSSRCQWGHFLIVSKSLHKCHHLSETFPDHPLMHTHTHTPYLPSWLLFLHSNYPCLKRMIYLFI